MSERLRYEDEIVKQLQDLPLPDEDAAWADMKRRLEEDEDDAIIVPPLTWGCGGWALLLTVLLGLGWWIVRPEKWLTSQTEQIKKQQEKTKSGLSRSTTIDHNNNKDSNTIHITPQTSKAAVATNNTDHKKPTEGKQEKVNNNSTSRPIEQQASLPFSKKEGFEKKIAVSTKKPLLMPGRNKPTKTILLPKAEDSFVAGKKDKADIPISIQPSKPLTITNSEKQTREYPKDTTQQKKKEVSVKANEDSVTKKEEQKKQTPIPKKYSFGAGLSLFQQIPVGGQSSVPYNSQGRKFSLTDYVPSVYARLHKENKWFIQAEFRYGAPQYTRQFTYGQTIVSDTFGLTSTITSQTLKKTFYHQLPVSFNYYILPNWSLGAGVVWNKFYSAVYEQDITDRNNVTQTDSTISKGIRQTKRDSALAKSYFQALFETQYKWKRFSLGARYSFGLQPYIKFRLPGYGLQKEKNSSLQVFLRYELWKSKKKK